MTSLVTSFIGLAFEELSSYLHNKRQKALQKAFHAKERKVNLERNKNFHLEDSMIMYGIYNLETVENLVNTVRARCTIKLHGMRSYLWVDLLFGLIGIY